MSSSSSSALSPTANKQQQNKHLAPEVIPDHPITKRYEGPLPDLDKRPHLLPLLDSSSDAPYARAPPQASWARLKFRNNAQNRVPFRAPSQPDDSAAVDWQAATYVCPAAYPRSHVNAAFPSSATYPGSPAELPQPVIASTPESIKAEEKRQRQQIFDDWHSYIRRNPPTSYFPPTTQKEADEKAQQIRHTGQAQLWNVINRYAPPAVGSRIDASDAGGHRENDEAVTIVLGHGTGLHKETWEPLLKYLLTELYAPKSQATTERHRIPRVAEIWSFDAINCGESVELNESILGEVVHQHDHARDFHNFVARYLPSSDLPFPSEPRLLSRRSDEGKRHPRRIIFIAHSVSASMLSILCQSHPELFAGIALIDPTILKFWPEMARERTGITNGGGSQLAALLRRDVWTTRAEAEANFRQKRAYKHWNPKTLDLWCRFGLRSRNSVTAAEECAKDGGFTTLACPKKLEAAAYRMMWLSSYPWTAWQQRSLASKPAGAHSSPQPRTLLIRVENTFLQSDALGEELEDVARAGGVDEVERWSGGDHLLVQTDPIGLGVRLARWVQDVMSVVPPGEDGSGEGQQLQLRQHREARL